MKLIIDIDDNIYDLVKQFEKELEFIDKQYDTVDTALMRAIIDGTPLPKCNECKYYEGVHKVQGHAPCSYHTIGGVMWDWYCSQFEADKGSDKCGNGI